MGEAAISYSKKNGLDMGVYVTYGRGGYSGVVVSAATEVTGSLNTDLNDLKGTDLTTGVSAGLGPGIGIQYNHVINSSSTLLSEA